MKHSAASVHRLKSKDTWKVYTQHTTNAHFAGDAAFFTDSE